MDFKRLGYFALVAELGSLSKASERLRIAQPSLSRQMRLLEEELGVVLFIRSARGMKLTEAGSFLFARVAGPMREIGHALYEIRSLPTETGGDVALGMPPTVVRILAGSLARRIAVSAPKISLRIVDAYTGHLHEWIKRGELDAAILYGPTPAGLSATKLLEDELMLVGPARSPIAAMGVVDFARLSALPLVLPSPAHGLRELLETAAGKAGVKLNVQIQADSYQLMMELVESGLGYTALPHAAFSRHAAEGRLSFARIRKPVVTRELFLALKPNAERARAILRVEELVRQEVSVLVQQGAWPTGRIFGPVIAGV